MKAKQLLRMVTRGAKKNSPKILTGIGIAGMATTIALSVSATPKALMLIEEEKRRQTHNMREEAEEFGYDIPEPVKSLKPIDILKVAWKPYIPAAIMFIGSSACIIGGLSVSARRAAAIATAYKISETALTEFKDKTAEVVGEEKFKEIKEKVNQSRYEKTHSNNQDIIITGKGDTLCYDTVAGREFRSDVVKIERSINELNRRMIYNMYVSLNELYDELGLDRTKLGDELGWNLDDGLIELDLGSIITDRGDPCVTIGYNIFPRYDYSKLM